MPAVKRVHKDHSEREIQPKEFTGRVVFMLEPELVEALDRKAVETDRSRSSICRMALRKYLNLIK